ncbi:MAG TPA: glycosyltransferase family 1 protein [Thermoanaerobaculia bacterium]
MRIGIDCRKIADFGIGTYVRGLVRGLAQIGAPEKYLLFVPRALPDLPFEQIVVDVPTYSLRELPLLGRAIARARLDLFHSPDLMLPWTSCPCVVTLHDVIRSHYPPRNPAARIYVAVMTPRALQKSVRVLTVTEAAKRAIVETFDCDAGKIAVTPNGVDEIFFADGPRAEGRYFLFVGNDKPHKNVERLVESLRVFESSSLRARRLDDSTTRLLLVGAAFERFRDVPGVIAPGFVSVDELAALYRGATALVMPSLEEGFGLPVVEAMAAGTPVIASDIPALREVTGGHAFHVDPRSVDDLARAMRNVTREHVDAARERARQFTWARCAELTREVYLCAR